MSIKFKKLNPDAIIPKRGTKKSAGFDLYALEDRTIIGGGGNVIVPTGIAAQTEEGTYLRIAMRSGLAVKEHLSVSAGVVDIDFKGEIGIVVHTTKLNHSYTIKKGERFAQLIPEKISYSEATEVDDFENTLTEHHGWGSTGLN